MPPILCRFDPFAFLPRCHWLFCHFVPFAIGPLPLCTKSLYVLNAVWDICHCVPNAFHQNASIVPCHLGTNALMRQTPFRDKCPSGSKATGSTKFLLLWWGNIGLKGTSIHITREAHMCNRGLLLFSFWKRAESDCLHTRLKGGWIVDNTVYES